jgi:hypothetical protein
MRPVCLLILSHASRKSLALFTFCYVLYVCLLTRLCKLIYPFALRFLLTAFLFIYPSPESFYFSVLQSKGEAGRRYPLCLIHFLFPNTAGQVFSRTASCFARYLPPLFLLSFF